MKNSNQFVYTDVTQVEIQSLIAELSAHGSTVQNQGSSVYMISGHGVTATASYVDSVLTVTVNKKPFFVSYGMIEDGIDKALAIENAVAPNAPVVMVPTPAPHVPAPETARGEGLVNPPAPEAEPEAKPE